MKDNNERGTLMVKIKTRLLIIIIYCCMLLLLSSSCAPSGHNIAFFIYKSNDTFISELMEYMIASVPEEVSFEVRDAGNSQSVQNQQIVELIGGDFDLFVINAVDRLACSSIIEKCAIEEIPVLFFNREPPEDILVGSGVFYVGADADNQGVKQAEMVAELFTSNFKGSKFDKNGDGIVQLVILKGEQGHQDAEKRTDSCVARFKELGFRVETLGIEVADWNRWDGYAAMRRLYDQFGDSIELVFSNNDDMALGAIDYLLDGGIFTLENPVYDQPFVIVGVDGTAVGRDAIRRGLLYGTVYNDSVKQADGILALVDYILNDKSFDDFPYAITQGYYINTDGDIITQTNVADFTGRS